MDAMMMAFLSVLAGRGYCRRMMGDQVVMERKAHGSTPACKVVIDPWPGGRSRLQVVCNCADVEASGVGGRTVLQRLAERLDKRAQQLLTGSAQHRPYVADELHRLSADCRAAMTLCDATVS